MLATAVACERGKPPPSADSVQRPTPVVVDSAIPPPQRNWNTSAGPLLLVAAESPSRAFVVAPDSATAAAQLASIPRPASVTLFGRGGTVQTAELPAVPDTSVCIIASLSAAPPPRPWSVGFIGGVVSPLPMDSLQSLSPADSLALAVSMTRLASALPNDSAGRFTGLPFVVGPVWRFVIPSGVPIVIATLIRKINQEATPLQEHTLIIAERRGQAGDTSFATAYSERSYGDEETIESRDVLAAALIGGSRTPAIIIGRDYGVASAFGLVERGDDGRWRPVWRSARRRC